MKLRMLFLISLLLACAFPAHAQVASRGACAADLSPTSRLVGGMYARVTAGAPNNVRADAGINAPLVAQIEPGQVVYITSAPACADGYIWWQVQFLPSSAGIDGFGWTAEGSGSDYWLEPVLQPLTLPDVRSTITPENVASLAQVARVDYGAVNRLLWSPDGKLFGVNTVGALWLYNLSTGAPPSGLNAFTYETNYVTGVLFDADGDTLWTAGGQGASAIHRWSLGALTPGVNLTPAAVTPIATDNYGAITALSPDGTLVALTGPGSPQDVLVKRAADGSTLHALAGHELVGALAFAPDGRTLLSGGGAGMIAEDKTLRLWDVATGAALWTVTLDSMPFLFTLTPDGGSVLAVSTSPAPDMPIWNVSRIDTATGTVLNNLTLPAMPAALAVTPDGVLLFVAVLNEIQVLRLPDFGLVGTLTLEHDVTALVISPDGTVLAAANRDPEFWGPDRVTLWTLAA